MASEFDFLRGKWPKLAAIAADASRLADIIPDSALKSLERYTMWSADIALDIYEIQVPGGATQLEKLEALQACGYVPVEILQKFHNVRTASNRSVSDMNSAADLANACLADCREIGQWLSRESDKSGFIPTRQFTPEYRVPISGMNTHAPEPDMMPGAYKFNRFMRQYGSYLALFAVIIVVVGLGFAITKFISGKAAEKLPPTFESIATPEVTFTPDPVMIVEATEAPPEILEPEYVLIDNVPISRDFEKGAKLYIGEWNVTSARPFQSANQTYNSGLGMFIPSKRISGEWANDSMSYNLHGMYEKIEFTLFVDTEGAYGISSEYGFYDIIMYADGENLYNSRNDDYMFYNDVESKTLILPEGTLTLTIELRQKKGTNGTLDVVIGDFFLYPYEDTDD